jgi:deazaflavin-dependent oxidoreductase (nitroreductase family)
VAARPTRTHLLFLLFIASVKPEAIRRAQRTEFRAPQTGGDKRVPQNWNTAVIEEFRTGRGEVGGPFEGGRLILLTTTGARSGRPHTTPLGYLPDEDGRVLVIASAGGSDRHPDWYRNLVAHPRVTIETGLFTYPAEAEVLTGEERDRLFTRAAEAQPGFGEYQAKTARVLPVVALRPILDGPPMAGSFGETLRAIHDMFRRELRIIRREVAASGPSLAVQLRVNCLTACAGLHQHHRGEDTGLFPALAAGKPELAPVIERLSREHEVIAGLSAELRAVLTGDGVEPGEVVGVVDRLIGELEEHLAYEEEHLIPVLG